MIRDLPAKGSTDWYDHYTEVDGAARNVISDVAATITAAATLAGDKHTPVNAAGGAVTVTLPTPARVGQRVRVEKVDSSGNAVTVSGTLRGAAGTVVMPFQYEVREFVAESLSSWRVAGGNTPKAALDATYVQTFKGEPTAVSRNSGKAGVLDWSYGDGAAAGYLFHFRASAASLAAEYAIGVGTDKGHGGGILVSHKNDGVAYRLDQQPGAGLGHSITSRAAAHTYVEQYTGSAGHVIALKSGRGYTDGVTNGTTTFTSATAAFTSGDVGKTITPNAPTLTALPAGVTIVSVESASSVTLSAAATSSTTDVRFTVGGRLPQAFDPVFQVFGTDAVSAASIVFAVKAGQINLGAPIVAKQASSPAADIYGASGQTSRIFGVLLNGNGTPALRVEADGHFEAPFYGYVSNAGSNDSTREALRLQTFKTGAPVLKVIGIASQTADSLQILQPDGTINSRFNKDGYLIQRKTAAPADADLAANDMALWLDATSGATKLMVKAKDSTGAVRTAAVALS